MFEGRSGEKREARSGEEVARSNVTLDVFNSSFAHSMTSLLTIDNAGRAAADFATIPPARKTTKETREQTGAAVKGTARY